MLKLYMAVLLLMSGLISLQAQPLPALKISADGRYFETSEGKPFFWLGDTGWLLFSKLTKEEAVQYLDDRKAKGFNVIQVMVLHSVSAKDVYGDAALVGRNVATPMVKDGYDYWKNIDYVVDEAEKRGIYMALVPIWGGNVKDGLVNRDQAGKYATFLVNRYKSKSNIIWVNGGDIPGSDSIEVWNTIGNIIHQLDKQHLVTFHPRGRTTSSLWFHNEPWLNFNMFQSGHRRYDQDTSMTEPFRFGEDNWKYVQHDYNLKPARPCLDAEPSYENIPQGLHDSLEVRWGAADVRRYGYWSVFAGACGYTYGNNEVMQMRKHGEKGGAFGARGYWMDAINDSGARQMINLKNLMLSRPYFERVPDQSIIASGQGEKYNYLVATRGTNYAYVYTYTGRNMTIALGKIAGKTINTSWYNPRTGDYIQAGSFYNKGTKEFNPPGEPANGNDWVLVMETLSEKNVMSAR